MYEFVYYVKQKSLPDLSPALSLKPTKYISAVDSTIPGGVKRSETQSILPYCRICNSGYYTSHDDVLH